MNNSAAPSNVSTKQTSTVTCLHFKNRADEPPPLRYPWTDELERRRKAVARWRGNESGLKETMMRE